MAIPRNRNLALQHSAFEYRATATTEYRSARSSSLNGSTEIEELKRLDFITAKPSPFERGNFEKPSPLGTYEKPWLEGSLQWRSPLAKRNLFLWRQVAVKRVGLFYLRRSTSTKQMVRK